jgi:uncharacterized protein with HEPN domain
MPSRSDGYLLDMLLAARSIQDFTSGQTQESFATDRLRIRAIEREFEILGEAARNVDEITRQQFPGLDFRAIVGMWNIVSHDYRRVRPGILWENSQHHVPKLISALEPYLESLKDQEPSSPEPDS